MPDPSPTIRGRYAPSPTGELHLGNARTALVAWLSTRAAGGRFVLRVEDLDPPRIVRGAECRILEDLRWLGIDWDEGPDVGGPFGPYRQSERHEWYRQAVERLVEAGQAFACRCTRKQLRGDLSAPHGPEREPPPYPGRCASLGLPVVVGGREASATSDGARGSAIRVRVPRDGIIRLTDRAFGEYSQDVASTVGDFVVRRTDGLYTYQLAVVVDDAAMSITEVVRGADLLHSTPRQIALQYLLGYPTPVYGHVPLVLGPAGERMAKRAEGLTIAALRAAGARPERLVGAMAHSLGLVKSPAPCRASELIEAFRWARIERNAWRPDPNSLLRPLAERSTGVD
jgi:glutamyl-tRNA synthetase